MVKDWIEANLYDHKLSVDNLVQDVANGTFPTAFSITLDGMVFDLGPKREIFFPENVTLENCQVRSGKVGFHRGTAEAILEGATVVACGSDATANATANTAKSYAIAFGATANATAPYAMAYATVSGATANATARAFADATAYGATANATAKGAIAVAKASGATANATANGAHAVATATGATANATANGAYASASQSGTIAHATAAGATAIASNTGSIAFANHPLAEALVRADNAKVIQHNEFMAIRPNLDNFLDKNVTRRERAGAAFLVGMAFCDGKDVKQSDTFSAIFLGLACELGHPNAAFELGELYSKKRSWFRQDHRRADVWYSTETLDQKKGRELAPKYTLLLQSNEDANSSLHDVPEDVLNLIRSFLSRL
jgi:hypothetical protein